jgi:hypothetical protein
MEMGQASVFSFDYCVSHQRLGSSKAFVHGTCIKATYSLIHMPAGVVKEENESMAGYRVLIQLPAVSKLSSSCRTI